MHFISASALGFAALAIATAACAAPAFPAPASRAAASGAATSTPRHDDTVSPQRYAPALDRAVRRYRELSRAKGAPALDDELQIDVVMHVITGPALEGDLPDARLSEQMATLNDAYRAAELHFAPR